MEPELKKPKLDPTMGPEPLGQKTESETVVKHLLADGQPEKFIELADLNVLLGKHVYPSNSSFLARHSKLLCELFTSTDREGWSDGVSTLVKGHREESLLLLLAMMHGAVSVKRMRHSLELPEACADWSELEDLLKLAHKMEALEIVKVRKCTRNNPDMVECIFHPIPY